MILQEHYNPENINENNISEITNKLIEEKQTLEDKINNQKNIINLIVQTYSNKENIDQHFNPYLNKRMRVFSNQLQQSTDIQYEYTGSILFHNN